MLLIDTNIWISYALFKSGDLTDTVFLALQKHDYAFSEDTFAELESVLMRDKFDAYLEPDARKAFADNLLRNAHFVKNVPPVTDCRDEKDNMFLALAKATSASYLVTGDSDLLVLDPYYNTRIATVSQLKHHLTNT